MKTIEHRLADLANLVAYATDAIRNGHFDLANTAPREAIMPKTQRADKYADMSVDEFDTILMEVINEHPASNLLSIAGIYEVLREEFNNEVLERWEQKHPAAEMDEG